MNERLKMCSGCQRHVFAHEVSCPFCRAPMARRDGALAGSAAIVVATAVAIGVAATGCDNKPAQGPKNPPDSSAATPTPSAPSGSSNTPTPLPPDPLQRGGQNPAPIYGGPPPP